MLVRLALVEFLIVERAALEFAPGLNVLTGETGAGKSILVDAISLLCGARGSGEWVRRGADRLFVEGELDLRAVPPARAAARRLEIPLEDGFGLLLRREIGADGRSRCFAGGRQVLVSQLRELTAGAVWIVDQGEQRVLDDPEEQEWLLDRFGRAEELRQRYREARAAFLEAREAQQRAGEEEVSFRREAEWLRAQAEEIRAAALQPGERVRLRELRERLRGRNEELALADEVEGRLFREENSVLDHLETLHHRLSHVEGESWASWRETLSELREAVRALRGSLPGREADLDADPDAVEERLRAIERVCRRYAPGAGDEAEAAVLARQAELEAELERGERLGAVVLDLEGETERRREALGAVGEALSRSRAEAGIKLAALAAKELDHLGMRGASVRFGFERETDPEGVPSSDVGGARVQPLGGGLERVRLMFRSHPTEAEGGLGRIASGGELSRVLLALHAALGAAAPPGCWVLDEIDAGIGGETANRLAARLSSMARRAQVLLVTHLPLIAARADRQYRVVKSESTGRPCAAVSSLDGPERIAELARMLSGDATSATARRHAWELLEAAADRRGVA